MWCPCGNAQVRQQAVHRLRVEEDDVPETQGKMRLDTFLATRLSEDASRARLQSSIKEGLVKLNGMPQKKMSSAVKVGDLVECSILPPPPLEAHPENIELCIVYEDDHVIVIDKEADMVMHPSPGHYSGTLVNAVLHHCGLSSYALDGTDATSGNSLVGNGLLRDDALETMDDEDDEDGLLINHCSLGGRARHGRDVIRPGIVHRLDKGTTGLVVVAKSDTAHASLSKQFKDRTVEREYRSITLGVPRPNHGRIETNIGRDFRDRKKMAAFAFECTRGKAAASNYKVEKIIASGTAALVSWKLETGRTHQIRVHAKHIQHPLLADEMYGGAAAAATRALGQGKSTRIAIVHDVVNNLSRPCLHAHTLGFKHPTTGEHLRFESTIPEDFSYALEQLTGLD